MIVVFNKVDAFKYTQKDADDLTEVTQENWSLEDWKKTWMARLEGQDVLFISAIRKDGMDLLRQVLFKRVRNIHMERYPYTPTPYWDESQWEQSDDEASETDAV
jgi:GTP-binding protein HflX